MSSDEFRAFADALEARGEEPAADPAEFGRVAVVGASLEGRLIACLCLAEGADVVLCSPYGSDLDAIRQTGSITLRGAGPIGTFQAGRSSGSSIALTGEFDTAAKGADLIVLAGPVLQQRAAASALGPVLTSGQTVATLPGRTFGSLEIASAIKASGCRSKVTIVEIQCVPFRIRQDGGTLHLTKVRPAQIASMPSGDGAAISGIMQFIPNAEPVANVIQSSFSDGSAIVELPALLMGGPAAPSGAVRIPAGGVPLEERNTFRALIGERHLALIAALGEERRKVASRWGVHDTPDDGEWLALHAGDAAGDYARPVPDEADADTIVRCAVIGSLMPLLSAAERAGVDASATRAMVGLAKAALRGGLAATGRTLDTVGIAPAGIDDARRSIERIAREGL